MTSPCPRLLEPLDLGFVKLRNRDPMGSMHAWLEDDPKTLPRLEAYFAERARGCLVRRCCVMLAEEYAVTADCNRVGLA